MIAEDPLEPLRGTSVRIELADGTLRGNGVCVAPGFALTAAHVVTGYACADVHVVWPDGGHDVCTDKTELAGPPPFGMQHPWPDVAVLEFNRRDHPCARLARGLPIASPAPTFYIWAYAAHYLETEVKWSSLQLQYYGPHASPPGRLLRLVGDRIMPGVSGAAVIDPARLEVCAIVKGTGNEASVPDGHATAIADVLALEEDVPAVKRMLTAYREHVDDRVAAAERWGTLPERVAVLLEDTGCGKRLARELGLAAPFAAVAEQPEELARWLFDTDLDALSKALLALVRKDVLAEGDAAALFEMVGCCLPLSREQQPVWWAAPDAAERLRRELSTEPPRFPHVPTDERTSIRMLVWRAFDRSDRKPPPQDVTPTLTPEPDEWFNQVERLLRHNAGASENWLSEPAELEPALEFLREEQYVFPLPPLPDPAALTRVRAKFGEFPYVLSGRGESPDSPLVVRIEPEIDVDVETTAMYYHRRAKTR